MNYFNQFRNNKITHHGVNMMIIFGRILHNISSIKGIYATEFQAYLVFGMI